MTTIIIIVVVALVFFAAVSLSVFIVWKRETEMRTNSIRFIEDNLIEIRKERQTRECCMVRMLARNMSRMNGNRQTVCRWR